MAMAMAMATETETETATATGTAMKKRRYTTMEGERETRMEVEKGRYLCLGSNYYIACIDLVQTWKDHGSRCRFVDEQKPTPLAHLICNKDIHQANLPYGLGSTSFEMNPTGTAVNSKSKSIYLIGGEDLDPKDRFKTLGTSNKIYQVNPIFSNSGKLEDLAIELADPVIPRMHSGKGCAIIEVIGQKLYVIHAKSFQSNCMPIPQPSFECLDLGGGKGEWEVLPDPPFVIRDDPELFGGVILSHSVIGDFLVVKTCLNFVYSFDTNLKKWSAANGMRNWEDLISCLPMKLLDLDFGNRLRIGIMLNSLAAVLVDSEGKVIKVQNIPLIFQNISLEDISTSRLVPLESSSEGRIVEYCACAVCHLDFTIVLAITKFSIKINRYTQRLILEELKEGSSSGSSDEDIFCNFLNINVSERYILNVPDGFYSLDGPAFFL